MTEDKNRLDIIVFRNNLATSRERAREYILSGKIYVDGRQVKKCGMKIDNNARVEMRGDIIPYVSRAGLKLEKALNDFQIKLNNCVCMDVGASTGGFTQCMLERGATKVFAIDVGKDQLVEKLKNDERVISMEETNIKTVTLQDIGEQCDFVAIDVSFISLQKVIPYVVPIIKEMATGVALIKPQFEAGRGNHSKKGVIKSKKVHEEVIESTIEFLRESGLGILGLDYSGIKGQNGNIEYLVYFQLGTDSDRGYTIKDIRNLVEDSHNKLDLEEL